MSVKKTLRASPIFYRQYSDSMDDAGTANITATVTLGSTPVAKTLLYVGSLEERKYSIPNVRNPAMTGYAWETTTLKYEVHNDYPVIALSLGKETGAAKGTAFTIFHYGKWSSDCIWEFPYLKGEIVTSSTTWAANPTSGSVTALEPVTERGLMAVALVVGGTGAGFALTIGTGTPNDSQWDHGSIGWGNSFLAFLIDPPIGSTPSFSYTCSGTLKYITAAMLLLR